MNQILTSIERKKYLSKQEVSLIIGLLNWHKDDPRYEKTYGWKKMSEIIKDSPDYTAQKTAFPSTMEKLLQFGIVEKKKKSMPDKRGRLHNHYYFRLKQTPKVYLKIKSEMDNFYHREDFKKIKEIRKSSKDDDEALKKIGQEFKIPILNCPQWSTPKEWLENCIIVSIRTGVGRNEHHLKVIDSDFFKTLLDEHGNPLYYGLKQEMYLAWEKVVAYQTLIKDMDKIHRRQAEGVKNRQK